MAQIRYRNYDDYIEAQQEFTQPILEFVRLCVQLACPDVKEEFKWNFPNFTYKGSILAHMAGFKQHATFEFWLGSQMDDPSKVFNFEEKSGMGQFGKITSVDQLPSKEVLVKYIQHAMDLTDQGKKIQINYSLTSASISPSSLFKSSSTRE